MEKPQVYFRRHLVLLAYSLTIFAWNLSGFRQTAIVPSFAYYHGITNQLSAPPIYGVDSFSLSANITLVLTSLLGAYAIDNIGLKSMIVGSFFLAVSQWIWYFAKTNTVLVILSNILAALFGPIVTASILAISNRWYPPHQRAKATAAASLISTIGGAAALVISPQFATEKHELVELELKSCDVLNLEPFIVDKYNSLSAQGQNLVCEDTYAVAKDSFCCYLPVDIPKLNLTMAIISTCAFIFTALTVRDLPPTPPAPSGSKKEYGNLWSGIKHIFSKEQFIKLSISDFIMSGPPIVAFSALSRIFPYQVANYSFIASAIGVVSAIPFSVVAGHFLDKTKWFYTLTIFGYSLGTIAWLLSTIALATRTTAGAYTFLAMVTVALSAFVVWQMAVYEAKLEYVFSPTISLEGVVVATDRVIINLSSFIFLSAIPPERVGGARNLFFIGSGIMVLGLIPTGFISNKYDYKRLSYDEAERDGDTEQT